MSSKGAGSGGKSEPHRALRVGVVGAGVMGSNHARVLAGLPGVNLAGVVDPLEAHRNRVTDFANCPTFDTLEQLLGEGVDAVTIAAPTHLHHEIALACIARKIHVMVEKPIASSVEEGRAIAEIVCVQNHYNLAHRKDDTLIDELAGAAIAYVPFFPLGGFTPLQSTALSDVAKSLGVTPMQVALAWLLQRAPNILLIPGTSSVNHLRENLAAARLTLPSDAVAALDQIARVAAGM